MSWSMEDSVKISRKNYGEKTIGKPIEKKLYVCVCTHTVTVYYIYVFNGRNSGNQNQTS